jgi:hypothetical protein
MSDNQWVRLTRQVSGASRRKLLLVVIVALVSTIALLNWRHSHEYVATLSHGDRTMYSASHVGLPRLQGPTELIDLGDGDPGTERKGVIKIENVGSADLTFTTERSCGCTRVEPISGVILPGQAVAIEVGLKLREYSNSECSVHVVLKTNDPITSSKAYTVVARSLASVDVAPSALNFGRLDPRSARQEARLLRVRDRRGESIRDPRTVTVLSAAKRLRLKWVKSGDGCYLLEVSLAGDFKSGDYVRDELSIDIPGGSRPFIIPVYATMLSAAALIPSTVVLDNTKANPEQKPLYIWVRADVPLGRLTSADGVPGVTVEECKGVRPGLRTLKLIVTPRDRPAVSRMMFRFEKFSEPLLLQVVSLRSS